MPVVDRSRSVLATVVGWVLVAVVVWFVLRIALGALFWVARGIVVVLVIAGLLWAYLALKDPPPKDPPTRR